jgi:hypothetical protein
MAGTLEPSGRGNVFLENNYVIPLFDTTTGGPPRAFECRECGHVTKTESGIRQHLRTKHDWKEQECLFSMESAKAPEVGDPRKAKLKAYAKQIIKRHRVSLSPEMERAQFAATTRGEPLEPIRRLRVSQPNTSPGKSNSTTAQEPSSSVDAAKKNSPTSHTERS